MRVLIAGWFSFEGMGASAGDLLARDLTAAWLRDAGIDFTVAVDKPFVDGKHWADIDSLDYTHVIFVCGPCGNGPPLTGLLDRFTNCHWIGLNLTMLQDLDEWNPFELLIERDSSRAVRADMVFLTQPLRVPRVGLILVHPQKEYGKRGRHEQVGQLIGEHLASLDLAVVPIDTRLDHNATGLHTSGQIESMIAAMDFTVTTRLHGTVLSIKNGVPPIVIDPIAGGAKVMAQCEAIRWPWCCRADELSTQWLDEAITFCRRPEAAHAANRCRADAQIALADMRVNLVNYLLRDKNVPVGDPE